MHLIFTLIYLIFSLLTISCFNAIYSVLSLISLTLLFSINLFLIGYTFISLLYIIVYIGAVAILFIFVIIIINSNNNNSTYQSINKYLFSLLFSSLFLTVLYQFNHLELKNIFYENNTSIEILAEALYSYNSLNLLLISLILLSCMIGPLILCVTSLIIIDLLI